MKNLKSLKLFKKDISNLNIDTCPARCKTTGKCYGKVYFEAKYDKPTYCDRNNCPWADKFKL